jgi:hypothetical protein
VDRREARGYRWTNVVVLVVSVYLLASSVWSTPEMMEEGVQPRLLDPRWLTAAYVGGGLAGLLAVALSLKSRPVGRGLTALGGVLILSGFLAMRELTPLAIVSMGLSGLALLAASFFMGPMPTPEDEGQRR